MAKVLRLVNGIARSVSIDQEVSIPNAATSVSVSFPATLQTGSATPRIAGWIFNSTDSSPQYQPIVIIARSSTSFTAQWNAATDSANYKLVYIVPDGFIV